MIKTNPVKHPTPAKAAQVVANEIKRKSHRIQDFPKPVRIATVQALKDRQYSIQRISQVLGMSKDTVSNYINETIDDEWVRYKDAVNKIMVEKRDTLKSLAANAIQEKLKDTSKIPLFQLSGLYKVLWDVDRSLPSHTNPTLVQTINVHPALDRDKLIVEDGQVRDK